MTLEPFAGPWPLFRILIFSTASRTPWTKNQPVARPLPARRTTQTQNKPKQTSMPSVGFEPTIPVFQRAKTVHTLDRAATVIDNINLCNTAYVTKENLINFMVKDTLSIL
jgi:hypothetical protein